MGIDISNHQGPISTDTAAYIGSLGYSFAILKAPNPEEHNYRANVEIFRTQTTSFHYWNFGLEAYCYIYFQGNILGQVARAIEHAMEQGIRRLWLDVEDPDALSAQQVISGLWDAVMVVRAAGLEPGIYTRRGYWTWRVLNTEEFSHLPLWDALYSPDVQPNPTVFTPYGGWDKFTVRQYAGTVRLNGISADLNCRPLAPSPT